MISISHWGCFVLWPEFVSDGCFYRFGNGVTFLGAEYHRLNFGKLD